MTIDEEDKMIEQIMADHNTQRKGRSWNVRSAMRILSGPAGE
jgi:hypothetical protein